MHYRSLLFRALGFSCLGIGLATAVIPLVPTVPFFLLAAFFLSKSSPEWHRWIRLHRQFGRTVRAWEDHGVLDWKIKLLTGSCIGAAMIAPVLVVGTPVPIRVIWFLALLMVFLYLVTRPGKIDAQSKSEGDSKPSV